MTISTETNKNRYTGNGSTNTFPYTFKLVEDEHIEVLLADADDVQTALTLDVDFTITGVGSDSGGDVILSDLTAIVGSEFLPGTHTVTIARVVPFTQLTDFQNQGGFFADTHEDAFDSLTTQMQRQQEEIDRAAKVSKTSGLTGDDFVDQINLKIDEAETAKDGAETARDEAVVAKLAAEAAQTAAASSAGGAATSASEAEASATAAALSEANAATSEANAATSEANAATVAESTATTVATTVATSVAEAEVAAIISDTETVTDKTWSSTKIDSQINTKVAEVVDSAPAALDTLNELAAALGDDENFATTVNNSIATKASQTDLDSHTNSTTEHGATGAVMGTANSQAVQNKTLDSTNIFSGSVDNPVKLEAKQDTTSNLETYATTAQDGGLAFSTDEKKFFGIADSELKGLGGGVGSPSLYGYIDADDIAVSKWDVTASTNTTLALELVNMLSGKKSNKLTQVAGSLGDIISSPVTAVPERAYEAGANILKLVTAFDGDLGDYKVSLYDVTNSVAISGDLILDPNKLKQQLVFNMPTTCRSIRVDFEVLIENTNSTLIFDDIELDDQPFGEASLQESETIEYTGYLSKSSDFIKYKDAITNESDKLVQVDPDQAGYTKYEFLSSCSFVATGTTYSSDSAIGLTKLHLKKADGTDIKVAEGRVAYSRDSVTLLGKAEVGDYLVMYANKAIIDSVFNNFSVTATATNDHVLVVDEREQAHHVGSAKWDSGDAYWQHTGTIGAFALVSGTAPTPVVNGNVTVADKNVLEIKVSDVRIGTYVIDLQAYGISSSDSHSGLRIYDGTSYYGVTGGYAYNSGLSGLTASIPVTSNADLNLSVVGIGDTRIYSHSPEFDIEFNVSYLPPSTEKSIATTVAVPKSAVQTLHYAGAPASSGAGNITYNDEVTSLAGELLESNNLSGHTRIYANKSCRVQFDAGMDATQTSVFSFHLIICNAAGVEQARASARPSGYSASSSISYDMHDGWYAYCNTSAASGLDDSTNSHSYFKATAKIDGAYIGQFKPEQVMTMVTNPNTAVSSIDGEKTLTFHSLEGDLFGTIDSNILTLPAGEYSFSSVVSGYATGSTFGKLYIGGAFVKIGTAAYAHGTASSSGTSCIVEYKFSLSSPTELYLNASATVAQSVGFGSSSHPTTRYTASIRKLS